MSIIKKNILNVIIKKSFIFFHHIRKLERFDRTWKKIFRYKRRENLQVWKGKSPGINIKTYTHKNTEASVKNRENTREKWTVR